MSESIKETLELDYQMKNKTFDRGYDSRMKVKRPSSILKKNSNSIGHGTNDQQSTENRGYSEHTK